MTSADAIAVSVHILDKEYKISCSAEEKRALQLAAEYVDQKMRELRGRGGSIGTDRIAVVAALNIAHELLQLRERATALEAVNDGLERLQIRVERALQAQ